MKYINNERGIALVTSLMFALIALGIVMSVLYLITQGIQVSSSHKKYKNAVVASYGGMEVFTKEIIPQVISGVLASTVQSNFDYVNLTLDSSDSEHQNCLKSKLQYSTGSLWSCGENAATVDPKSHPDATFTLSGLALQPNFKVYTQIVDTVRGNSDQSGNSEFLDGAQGVTGRASGVNPMHIPALYTIEVQGERETNPNERARLSVLYAF